MTIYCNIILWHTNILKISDKFTPTSEGDVFLLFSTTCQSTTVPTVTNQCIAKHVLVNQMDFYDTQSGPTQHYASLWNSSEPLSTASTRDIFSYGPCHLSLDPEDTEVSFYVPASGLLLLWHSDNKPLFNKPLPYMRVRFRHKLSVFRNV
jgi:hypothetical protein